MFLKEKKTFKRANFTFILFMSMVNIPVYALSSISGSANGRYCCSKIFVNHRCFSGPYLNKGRIAELPQAVGPGKCTLVLKEVGCCQKLRGETERSRFNQRVTHFQRQRRGGGD